MRHGDSNEHATRLAEVLEILARQAAAEDRELLLAFAPILFAEHAATASPSGCRPRRWPRAS